MANRVDETNGDTDLALLERYVKQQSREAIEKLVRRNARWVHAVAMRRLRDPHHADDVVQAVFLILAQSPPNGLTREGALAGWLFRVACRASNRVLRSESRRRRREKAFAMEHRESSPAMSQRQWEELAPHLDAAVQWLNSADREAVLLRFYQRKSHEDIAAAMGVSAETARKRVQRAVEKMRSFLSSQGVQMPTATALVTGMETFTSPHAPTLTIQSALAATEVTNVSAHVSWIAKGTVLMLAMNKTMAIAAGCVLALLALLGGSVALFQSRAPESAPTTQTAANWQSAFYSVYKLEEGEALKNIPAPYIPERLSYYTTNQAKLAQTNLNAPSVYVFEWQNNQLRRWGTLSGETSRTVSSLIGVILGLRNYQVEAPPEFLFHRLSGDWIRRVDSTPAERLDAVCRIVQQQSGPAVRFVQRKVMRPTIVAKGEFRYRPAPGVPPAPESIHLYIDEPDLSEPGRGGRTDNLNEIIQELGSTLNIPVVTEITGGDTHIDDSYHKIDRLLELPSGPQRDEAVRKVLDHIEQQTQLKLTIEPREVPVWLAEPALP